MDKRKLLSAAIIFAFTVSTIVGVLTVKAQSVSSSSTSTVANTVGLQGWVKQGIVLKGTNGQSWDQYICEPFVLYEDGVFKMWYRGSTSSQTNPQIGFANSTDGIHWSRYGPPIIPGLLAYPCVLRNGSDYIMYVGNTTITRDGTYSVYTSANGIDWSLTASNVLSMPSWAFALGHVYVWKEGAEWCMLFEACTRTEPNTWKIGLATSTDGIKWVEYEGNPILQNSNYLQGASGPDVIHIGNMYGIWYHGGGLPTDIYYTNSTTLRTTLSEGALVVGRSLPNEGPTSSCGQVANPHVIEVSGQTWMYYDSTPGCSTSDINLAISNLSLAEMLGVDTPIPTPTPTPSPIETYSPTLTLSCNSSTSYAAFKVEINGNLAVNGTGLSESPILISYSINGGKSWQDLTLLNTGADGGFSAEWLPWVTGNYLINATYAGDSTHSRASTIVNLAVTPFASQDIQEVFSVASNSTVSDLVFNSTSRELSFTVTGISGTTGYVEVNIAKTLVDDITSVKAYIDGNGIEYTTTSTADSWLLQFNYHHSTHTIILDLGQTEPESLAEISQAPLAVGGAIGVVAIAATIVVTKKKAPKKVNAEYVNKHSLAE